MVLMLRRQSWLTLARDCCTSFTSCSALCSWLRPARTPSSCDWIAAWGRHGAERGWAAAPACARPSAGETAQQQGQSLPTEKGIKLHEDPRESRGNCSFFLAALAQNNSAFTAF